MNIIRKCWGRRSDIMVNDIKRIETLDKKEKTRVVFGSTAMKLDEFEDMVNRDPNLKRKMKTVDEELEKY
jgi:hypothetical protein